MLRQATHYRPSSSSLLSVSSPTIKKNAFISNHQKIINSSFTHVVNYSSSSSSYSDSYSNNNNNNKVGFIHPKNTNLTLMNHQKNVMFFNNTRMYSNETSTQNNSNNNSEKSENTNKNKYRFITAQRMPEIKVSETQQDNSETENKTNDQFTTDELSSEGKPRRKWSLVAYFCAFVLGLLLLLLIVIGWDTYLLANIKRSAVDELRNDPQLLRQLNTYIGYSILYDTGLSDMAGISTYALSSTLDSHLGSTYVGRGRPFSIRVKGSRGEGMILGVHNQSKGEFTDFVLVKGGGETPPIPLRCATVDMEKGHNAKMLLGGMKVYVAKQKESE